MAMPLMWGCCCWRQVVGAVGLLLLLGTGELAPRNVLGFCVAASNAFGLIAGACTHSRSLLQDWESLRTRRCPRAMLMQLLFLKWISHPFLHALLISMLRPTLALQASS